MLGGQYLSHEILKRKFKKNFELGILETIAETYLEFMGLKSVNVQIVPVPEDLREDILIRRIKRDKKHG